jgi:sialic acid synthase
MAHEIKVIAEIGCNHMGSMDTAKEMIQVAANVCHAHVAKFQKRNNRELLSSAEFEAPHPVPHNSYGTTYGEHREFLEFTAGQHRELQEECRLAGIDYSTSVWDLTSAKEIIALEPLLIKIPSATNQHYELQDYLCRHYDGEIHVSTGMTTRAEIARIVEFYEERGRAKDLVIYACTSGYPVEFEDVCLLEINRLQEIYGDRVKAIGFSGHHHGIAADVAAMTVGHLGFQRYGQGVLGVYRAAFHAEPHLEGYRSRRQPRAGRTAPAVPGPAQCRQGAPLQGEGSPRRGTSPARQAQVAGRQAERTDPASFLVV